MAKNKRMRGWHRVFGLIVVGLCMTVVGFPKGTATNIERHIPKDPIVAVFLSGFQPGDAFDQWIEFLEILGGGDSTALETVRSGLEEIDRELGLSLRRDVLAVLGDEWVVFLDFSDLDQLIAAEVTAEMNDRPEDFFHLLDCAVVATVADPVRLDQSLKRMVAESGLVWERRGEVVRVSEKRGVSGSGMNFYYEIRGNLLAGGFSSESVGRALRPRAQGDSVLDGADYSTVFRYLDSDSSMWVYVNLPKIRALLKESRQVTKGLENNPDIQRMFEYFAAADRITSGLGMTVTEMGRGIRQTVYGPKLFSRLFMGGAQAGVIGAIAIPNLANSVMRGRQKATMADLRTLATVLNAYAVDYARYPGPGGRWVDVEVIASELSPTYIKTMPLTDGWGHPFRYFKNDSGFLLVSPGADGSLERDWSFVQNPIGVVNDFDADIVYGNGDFVQWPEGIATW